MRCRYCSYADSKVVDSRPTEDGTAIRRRRECLEIDLGDTWVELYAAGRDLVGTCCTFNLNRSVVESGADNFNVVKTVVIIGYLKALDYGTAAFNKVHGLYVSGYGLKMVCAVHGAHFRNPAQRAVGVRVRLFPWMLVKFGQTFVPEHFIVLAVCHNFKGKISIGTCPDVTAVTGVVIGNDELVLTESNPVYSGTPFVLECPRRFRGSSGPCRCFGRCRLNTTTSHWQAHHSACRSRD